MQYNLHLIEINLFLLLAYLLIILFFKYLVLSKDYNSIFHWIIIIVDYFLFNKPLSECPGAHYNLCISPHDVHFKVNIKIYISKSEH